MRLLYCVAALLAVACMVNGAEASKNKINSLPGLTFTPQFDQYTGYITIDESLGKEYFYWFVESENDRENDPIVLWMQGGPGCSGLLGMFQENGPWKVLNNGTLGENHYSWNKLANVIYLEQPAGVGFSFSNNSAGYSTNDNQTASDNYTFLQGFFNEFPEFSANNLYLTGESYAGVYVPTLANQIAFGSDEALKDQFKGFMVGNPVIHCPAWVDHTHTVVLDMYYWHGMASFYHRQAWKLAGCEENENTPECDTIWLLVQKAMDSHVVDGDNLYQNFCTGNATLDFDESTENCYSLDDRTESYLNRPDVQAAIFAHSPPAGHWEYCLAGFSEFNYTQQGQNMIDYYLKLFEKAPSLRILVYSGDIDLATVPHGYTQLCLASMSSQVNLVHPWRRWTVPGPTIPAYTPHHDDKSLLTAGFEEVYEEYTFATVRGAGHEVPQYQPLFAFKMFASWVVNQTNMNS
mmetsp:Transcript_4641/g.16333  ORF Transcript_4641/g.16333 Transcript_4641/m.16333 type:complete len:463 (+) Transcript_4641:73-1461(+)